MRGDERRELILRQAKRVFGRLSYQEASTSELARESGISEPMLYKHFGSKKGLFLAVLAQFGTQFRQRFEQRVRERIERSLLEALENIVEDYRAMVKADPDVEHAFFQSVLGSHDPEIASYVEYHNRQVFGLIRYLIIRAQYEGLLSPDHDPEMATWGLMSILITCQYNLILKSVRDIRVHQGELNRVWLRGLRTPPEAQLPG
jgi:AcrR family transcriptional regulator